MPSPRTTAATAGCAGSRGRHVAAWTAVTNLLHIDALVRDAAHIQPVTLRIEGQQRPLAAGMDLSAYGIVQEAITNAIKHAPGAAITVVVRYCHGAVELRVGNCRAVPSSHDRCGCRAAALGDFHLAVKG